MDVKPLVSRPIRRSKALHIIANFLLIHFGESKICLLFKVEEIPNLLRIAALFSLAVNSTLYIALILGFYLVLLLLDPDKLVGEDIISRSPIGYTLLIFGAPASVGSKVDWSSHASKISLQFALNRPVTAALGGNARSPCNLDAGNQIYRLFSAMHMEIYLRTCILKYLREILIIG